MTVAIVVTHGIINDATSLWIGHIARWARAFGSVVVGGADFIDVTFRGLFAWVLTFVVDASLVKWTFRVASALENDASYVGIATESWWAIADRMVIDSSAFGSRSAFTGSTNRDALSVDTGMCSSALAV